MRYGMLRITAGGDANVSDVVKLMNKHIRSRKIINVTHAENDKHLFFFFTERRGLIPRFFRWTRLF